MRKKKNFNTNDDLMWKMVSVIRDEIGEIKKGIVIERGTHFVRVFDPKTDPIPFQSEKFPVEGQKLYIKKESCRNLNREERRVLAECLKMAA